MAYEIETKDGIVLRGIPDNVAPDSPEVKAKVAAVRRQQAVSAQTEADRKLYDPTAGMSVMEKGKAGFGKAFADIGRRIGQFAGAVSESDIDASKRTDAALMNTGAGMAGNVLGNVAASLPAAFVPGANTLAGAAVTGAAMGAMQPVGTDDSTATNMVLGGGAGALGQATGTAIGRVLRPVQSTLGPEAGRLAAEAQRRGIPLDAADLTGSRPLTTMRDVLAQLPLTADAQAAQQAAKQTAFNRAVAATIGQQADAVTPQVATAARNQIGQQFTDLAARNALAADDVLLNALAATQAQAGRYGTPDVARVVANNIDDIMARVEAGDVIPGQAYRALDSQMGRIMRQSANGDIRHNVGQVRDALRAAMDRSISPADQAAWREARRQYANLMTIAPLAARDELGDVSGRALLAAANRGNRSAAFSGGGELGELGRIGRAFVAEQTPNSGTAQRTMIQNMLLNPISTSAQTVLGGASVPMQRVLNSDAGRRYFTQGAVPLTPAQLQALSMMLRTGGTGAGLTYATQQ